MDELKNTAKKQMQNLEVMRQIDINLLTKASKMDIEELKKQFKNV